MNKHTLAAVACLAAMTAGAGARADTYGPDAFGYTAADNLGLDAVDLGFTFTDIADPQTIMLGASECCVTGAGGTVTCTEGVSETDCDAMGGEYEPPAPLDDAFTAGMTDFAFPMYGFMYGGGASEPAIYVSTNGFISFGADFNTDLSNDCPLPQPVFGGGARIYALHDDLVSYVHVFEQDAEDPDPVYPHPSGTDRDTLIIQWTAAHFPAFAAPARPAIGSHASIDRPGRSSRRSRRARSTGSASPAGTSRRRVSGSRWWGRRRPRTSTTTTATASQTHASASQT